MSDVENLPLHSSPKIGILVPNRVFVGGLSIETTARELHELFSQFCHVKAAKIIPNTKGVSRGYGFITFQTEEDAMQVLKHSEGLILNKRQLNVSLAFRKLFFINVPEENSCRDIPTEETPMSYDTYPLLYGGSVEAAPIGGGSTLNSIPFEQQNGTMYFMPQECTYPNTLVATPFFLPPPQFSHYMASPQYPTELSYSYTSNFSLPPYPTCQDYFYSAGISAEVPMGLIKRNPADFDNSQTYPFQVPLMEMPLECCTQQQFPNFC